MCERHKAVSTVSLSLLEFNFVSLCTYYFCDSLGASVHASALACFSLSSVITTILSLPQVSRRYLTTGRSAVPGAKGLTSTSGHLVVVAAAVLTQSSDLK